MSDQLNLKVKKALQAGRSGKFAKKTPYERFGFSQNPFRLDTDPDNPDFQIDREDVLLSFAAQVGNAIRLFEEDPVSQFRHLLSHGLRGCGKSSLARHFDRVWEQIGFQDYDTLYTDLKDWREPFEVQELSSSSKTLETYERFLRKIMLIEKPLIVFIDNLDFTITGTPAIPRIKDFMSDIETRAHNGFIIIGFVQSLTLTVLLESEQQILARAFLSFFNPEHFFFPIFTKHEIRKLITSRVRISRIPTSLFSTKSIEIIADHSLGIPTVALNIATACLNELIVQNADKVTIDIVNKVINQFGFSEIVQLVDSIDKDSVDETSTLMTPKRKEIIATVLGHQIRELYFFPPTGSEGLRSSDLAELFGVNLSTMNYHLKPLTTFQPIPILEAKDDVHDARSKIFCIDWDSPTSNALEVITVYQNLKQEKYHVIPATIMLSRRENP
ncbi:MAG: hypothetical protein ACFFAU_06835 [Candidatus Hodarchaeota archaeon]